MKMRNHFVKISIAIIIFVWYMDPKNNNSNFSNKSVQLQTTSTITNTAPQSTQFTSFNFPAPPAFNQSSMTTNNLYPYNNQNIKTQQNIYEEENNSIEINQAKQNVIDAQYEFNKSIKSLSYDDWENQPLSIEKKLKNLQYTNDTLNSLDSSAGAEMEWEIRKMKREMQRLDDENWQYVAPDIERRNRHLNWEADNIDFSIDDN